MMKWLRSILEWVKNLFCKKTMRRKITLYIADQLVDLDDQSFILFNYQMDDLSNPTIVKNSFSQQITLKGTANNNRIFGHYFKTDRRISNTGGDTGTDFNASQKTPFTIYDEMGHILESGYIKLDSISRQRADIQYKVTLYGGLGSFFYALSYDENGNKRNLASLDYLGTSNPETELNFTITAQAVQDAWARLRQDTSVSPIWDVINFAPAYNGIPDGNFSPDKALVDPTEVGLRNTITEGEGAEAVEYTTKSGYCLVNLAEAQDEWAVKDLRSYLQRPVFSMKAFWDAICNPANNGGYEVDADVVKDYLSFGKYSALWMTLPMISSIGSIQQESGDLTLTMSSSATSGNSIGRFDIVGSVPSGTKVTANLNCKIRFNTPSGSDSYTELSNIASHRYGRNTQSKYNVIFIQAVAYGSDDSVVGGSKIKAVIPRGGRVTSAVAAACGYVPAWSADYEGLSVSTFNKVSAGVFEIPQELGFTIEAQDVAYFKILVSVYSGFQMVTEGSGGGTTSTSYSGDGSTSTPKLYVDYVTDFSATSTFIIQGATGNSISYTSSESLRSGATITKAMLLSSSHTPAEYMLSFCKIFGLYFTYDNDTRKVTILRRNDLYQDETIDLEKRVDLSKGVTIQPLVFQAKWYDFILEGVGGAFYDEYLNVEGVPYGIQRVNTGFDFNADSVNLMDSVVFKNACTILARSKYFNYIFQGRVFKPSPFLDKGNTYTLWSADGDTLDTDISCPPDSASVTYYNDNPAYKGYDIDSARKIELRNADNKPIDGSDILVFLEGWNTYPYFKLTDDVPAMDVLNDGVPCWLLGAGDEEITYPYTAATEHGLPNFQTGILDTSIPSTYKSSPLIDISNAKKVVYTNLFPTQQNPSGNRWSGLVLYDQNQAFVGAFALNPDGNPTSGTLNLADYPNAKYLRFAPFYNSSGNVDTSANIKITYISTDLYIPIFQRYVYGNIHLIEHSLDFGVPKEMDIPGVSIAEGCTIYERGWKKYISDRYDVNTKVMTCRVNFAGIPVTQELLRKFYWYDNSLWVLNAIRNYSLTTYDPVECEFVQVQDKDNYLNGQTY